MEPNEVKVKFKPGDKVRFINPSDKPVVTQQNEFAVRLVLPGPDDDRVFLEGHPGAHTFWWAYRFELVKEARPARWCANCGSPPERQPGSFPDGTPCTTCGDFKEEETEQTKAVCGCPLDGVDLKCSVHGSPPTHDFSGQIDGAGVKGVMKNPKCPLDLIPPQFTEGMAGVLLDGARKYAPGNWMRGMSWETVMGGILRHLTAFRRGEEMDLETGRPHLFHAACGLMFLSYFAHGPKAEEYRRLDDRKFKTLGVSS